LQQQESVLIFDVSIDVTPALGIQRASGS